MSASGAETLKPDAVVETELYNELGNLRAENEALREELDTANEQLATLAADREELAQLKKQAKEAAAEIHREGRSIELEKTRWQRELSDARAELADAKATILKQSDKIRELERGYSFKPNPAEAALRLEIGDLRAELEACKQQPEAASRVLYCDSKFKQPEAADLLNQLKGRRKKSRADLADVEAILEILGDCGDE